ncbi:hypothetical protein [Streptomyces axinellae]|uniref:Uncharacterized protein n=1 Tax=Streptomyces axinellae TaxID=552788 RepID=A0ABN3QL83_9ACTN
MTREEYEDRRRRLSSDMEDARQTLNRARARYDKLADEMRTLRIEWQEAQKA